MLRKLLTWASFVWLLMGPASAHSPLESGVIDAGDEDRTLVHVEEVDASIDVVWDHYTKADKVSRWMAPIAQVDLRAGGSILTHYNPCSAIGDEGTITLKILAYVPETLIILQSDLESQRDASWMNETVYQSRERLYNLVEFETLENGHTQITSWGLGYGQGEEWATMIAFFERGNSWSYQQLRKALDGDDVRPACEKGRD